MYVLQFLIANHLLKYMFQTEAHPELYVSHTTKCTTAYVKSVKKPEKKQAFVGKIQVLDYPKVEHAY